jgi:hypothetical protein
VLPPTRNPEATPLEARVLNTLEHYMSDRLLPFDLRTLLEVATLPPRIGVFGFGFGFGFGFF